MKHRLVLGSPARGTNTLSYHGLLRLRPSSSLAQHAPLRVAAGTCSHAIYNPRYNSTSGETWQTAPHLRPSIHPHSSTSPSTVPLPMGEQLRRMMRLLPHSVAVCTSCTSSSSTSDSSSLPRGMTVSSFTSLSLSPPLVTFHVATPSRTLDAIRASGLLNFHVLAGDARGARAAHHFTGGNAGSGTWSREGLRGAGLRIAGEERKDDAGEVDMLVKGNGEPPVLTGDGVMYVLRCRLFSDDEPATHGGVVMVRDHAIVVAEVVEMIETSEKSAEGHEEFGLVYADRHYRMLGGTLVRKEVREEIADEDMREGREGREAAA